MHEKQAYLVFEYVPGSTLTQQLKARGAMPAHQGVAMLLGVLDALDAAHAAGVVHRDLKPSNVFLSTQSTGERVVKLLDFGLAKQNPVTLADVAEGPLMKASLVAGTPEYIAPEQARGFAPTPRDSPRWFRAPS